ncbi:MAG: hypothetical protein HY738_17460 [Bacteroidia bacterium]|nr:hypothetical protein [Bacteroidia bacterium]
MINEGKGHPFHQFAVTALQGKMKFPVIIFMDEQNKFLTVIPDFRTAENLEPVLRFFKEDIYKTTKYEEFIKTFVSQIKKTN